MDAVAVEKQFKSIGARVKINAPRRFPTNRNVSIDVGRDEGGEFFDIDVKNEIDVLILDAQKDDKHLLLMTRETDERNRVSKAKYLCGHDERNWFTCAIPESAGVTTVFQAKQALKPEELQTLESQEGIRSKHKHKRHRRLKSGRKIHRQGEFMFIPEYDFTPPDTSLTVIHKNEPMQRGGGNAHFAQYLYRNGGETVYTSNYSDAAKNGFTPKEYQKVFKKDKDNARKFKWEMRVRNPLVYAKGKISHIEHKTLDLGEVWHKVVLNTENKAAAARNVAFLD